MIKATLSLRLCDEQLAESVARALQPDNERPPPYFKIVRLRSRGCELTYLIEGGSGDTPKDLLTLLSIVDEISRLSEALKLLVEAIR
ncbi:MAG: hypothetical protein J7L12_00840 [Desulfurococcales archaeon]|nr:hypothetical protein [Desulfurococcales archaeon]